MSENGTDGKLAMLIPNLTVSSLSLFLPFQIEKIMSSIGEGIDFSQEQQKISGMVPSGLSPRNMGLGV
jgi:hypothetical protein